MRLGRKILIGVASGLAMIGIGSIALRTAAIGAARDDVLSGDDFAAIRREILTIFPRGSRITDVALALRRMRFRCNVVPHRIPNISAESLRCDSNGRGYPTSPVVNLTILGRDGMLSDVEVWNMLRRADADSNARPGRSGVAPKPSR